ncbi:MAG: metallophosphoesterase [Clostridia bacterium]|nr:metallophosphoesterase [Clostridia bacterium]
MSVYVTSDLHGLPLADLKRLLNIVNFNNDDWLFILGDVIDRQNDGGVEILKWLLEQPNAQLILGNHEAMLLSCDFVFEEVTDESIENFTKEKMELLMNYTQNGGDVTLKALRGLMQTEPDTLADILDYLRDAPLYETVSVGNKDFLLVHAGLDNFDKNKKLADYTVDELIWAWPKITDEYFDDVITVFGHTPTMSYDHANKGKILKTKTWIDIDVGVPYGNSSMLLRLDDLKEFYLF